MVDEALILRKISQLDEYHKQIKEYEQITVAQYLDDWKIPRIIERTLQMMIETCVDIASHIIADKKLRVPVSYSDTFKVLYEEKIVSSELKIQNLAFKFLSFQAICPNQLLSS